MAQLWAFIGLLLVVLPVAGCASPAPALQTQQLETVGAFLQLYGTFAGIAALGASGTEVEAGP